MLMDRESCCIAVFKRSSYLKKCWRSGWPFSICMRKIPGRFSYPKSRYLTLFDNRCHMLMDSLYAFVRCKISMFKRDPRMYCFLHSSFLFDTHGGALVETQFNFHIYIVGLFTLGVSICFIIFTTYLCYFSFA